MLLIFWIGLGLQIYAHLPIPKFFQQTFHVLNRDELSPLLLILFQQRSESQDLRGRFQVTKELRIIPEYIGAENWAVAVAIGIVSGFAATGVNQIYKQLTEK